MNLNEFNAKCHRALSPIEEGFLKRQGQKLVGWAARKAYEKAKQTKTGQKIQSKVDAAKEHVNSKVDAAKEGVRKKIGDRAYKVLSVAGKIARAVGGHTRNKQKREAALNKEVSYSDNGVERTIKVKSALKPDHPAYRKAKAMMGEELTRAEIELVILDNTLNEGLSVSRVKLFDALLQSYDKPMSYKMDLAEAFDELDDRSQRVIFHGLKELSERRGYSEQEKKQAIALAKRIGPTKAAAQLKIPAGSIKSWAHHNKPSKRIGKMVKKVVDADVKPVKKAFNKLTKTAKKITKTGRYRPKNDTKGKTAAPSGDEIDFSHDEKGNKWRVIEHVQPRTGLRSWMLTKNGKTGRVYKSYKAAGKAFQQKTNPNR